MYSYMRAETRGSIMKEIIYSAAGTVVPNSQGNFSEDLLNALTALIDFWIQLS